MNRSHTIREYIAENPDTTCGEIAEALGMTSKQVGVPLFEMARAGMVLKDGPRNRFRYSIGRTDIQKRYATEEERAAARRESWRKCEIKRTGRVPGARKPAMSREEHLSRRREREAKRRAEAKTLKPKRLKIAKTPKPSSEFRAKLHASVQAAMAAKAKPAQRAATTLTAHFAKAERTISVERETETVEQFMARGGMVDRLPPGAGNSLRVLGVEL